MAMVLAGFVLLTPTVGADPRPAPADDEFHFVVLGDSQFDHPAAFNRLIDQTRLLRPAFVIQVGDLIDGYLSDLDAIDGQWRRFQQQIAPLGPVTYVPIPGNHDVYGGKRLPDPALERRYEALWGDLYFHFRYRNSTFIGLNSDPSGAPNSIDSAQMAWLKQVLAANEAEHTFVFMHRPLRQMSNGDALHELLRNHGVSHVFYGHFHHYHHEVRDGVHYVMTNASGENTVKVAELGGDKHLVQVSVRDNEVSVAIVDADNIHPIDYVVPADNADYFALIRQLVPPPAISRQDDTSADFDIVLTNPTNRSLDAYVTCGSQDGRWQFSPSSFDPVRLGAKAKQTVSIAARFDAERQPESLPECLIEVPFRTARGQWLRYEKTVSVKVESIPDIDRGG